jgi:hypothetical protein
MFGGLIGLHDFDREKGAVGKDGSFTQRLAKMGEVGEGIA